MNKHIPCVERGEHKENYSKSFRHFEFLSALSATIVSNSNHNQNATKLYNHLTEYTSFVNAFTFDPTKRSGLDMVRSAHHAEIYNDSLQFVTFADGINKRLSVTQENVIVATKRCAMIHTLYGVVAHGMEYEELVDKSLNNTAFDNIFNANTDDLSTKSWALYRDEFSFAKDLNCPRFGNQMIRSESKERAAITALKPLLKRFGGKVNLKNPDCPIHLLEGLRDDIFVSTAEDILYKILCVRLSSGAKHTIMAPNTRICKTTTPLCSMTAYIVCNIAMIRDEQTVLDPFAGSAATLLAASLVAPHSRTVGIEVLSDETVSREQINQDFSSRNRNTPLVVLEGDAMDEGMRDDARNQIGGEAFDVIVTDVPYGRREKFVGSSALSSLIDAVAYDESTGKPLLKNGGRIVAFQPCSKGQNIHDMLPTNTQLRKAGLKLQDLREQRLNNGLSRWILLFLKS